MVRVWRLRNLLSCAALAAVFAVLAVGVHFSGAYALFTGGTVRKLPVYSVETAEKKLAITFDCAWGTEHTDAILRELERAGVRATFFMVQFWAEKYPEYVKKIADAGHEIGTHSATHSYMSKLSAAAIAAELESSSAAIEKVTGKEVELFRAPYGDYDDRLIETAAAQGYTTVQWDVDSLDWKDLSASEIALRVTGGARQGSIILCHNNGLHTAEALPAVFSALQSTGYTFVPVGELLIRGPSTIDAAGRQHPAG